MTSENQSAWTLLRGRLAVPLLALVATHVLGVVGYMLLWRDQGGTFSDALFMTFVTVSTLGFGEVKPLDDAGRALTMAVAAGGIGSLFYSFTVTLDWLSSEEMQSARRRRKMNDQIATLSDHYILAGFGRVGREAARELRASDKQIVVIDRADDHVSAATEIGCLHVKGDATSDEVLRAAGIERARGLFVTTGNDATNLYIVLSARLLASQIFIISRAVDSDAVPKLERAGANRAVSPYAIGGRRMANLMLSPRVIDFFETALRRGSEALSIGELQVSPGTSGVGLSLDTLRKRSGGATVLAILRGADGRKVEFAADEVLEEGDHRLALGTDKQLEALESSLGN